MVTGRRKQMLSIDGGERNAVFRTTRDGQINVRPKSKNENQRMPNYVYVRVFMDIDCGRR